MSLEVWIAIGLVFVGTWTVIIIEFRRTPTYPDDYIDEEEAELREDPPPPNEKSPPSSQTYSDGRVYKHWEYPHTDCQWRNIPNVVENKNDWNASRVGWFLDRHHVPMGTR